LLNNNYRKIFNSLIITVILGIYFSILQLFEYLNASFSISDSSYGSSFFIATGFHGFHVLIGTLFLLICLIRHYSYHFSIHHYFGLEAAA
jgi:cytochrome c oxidase subunit 3